MNESNRLKGKWAVITGATSGIGKSAAKLFAEAGCNLILTGRREERLSDFAKELKSNFQVQCDTSVFDVRDRTACSDFVDSISHPVDILINNAGLAVGTDPVDAGDFDDWDRMIDTNVKGLLNITRLMTPSMKKHGSGHIINIGSIAGHEAYPGGVVYCATKHAVHAITQSMKKDLHGTNNRVSEVSPGLVETEFSNVRFKGDDNRADDVYKGMKPLTALDIAEIVQFIANRPDHVNIMDVVVFPVQQSSATMIDRNS
ncbi:SDR family NAD(P)-dependent oxidoreductase [Rhodohalobacter sp. SW132]|uniref:SDR family NAD(P)-dependent oxidoreductase n=1 Tax=Rhodohalobacter sp. SW132 TaxID=2293433 RepID=UPI000E24417A|nr:SDR family NAD(P)-dependent oxidoreductase [Rhodohalobacter sp. SW132]REL24298.1 SDR family NAD(P)-dependent oxidoreductase [Rhodohalobacter sp. SW132]